MPTLVSQNLQLCYFPGLPGNAAKSFLEPYMSSGLGMYQNGGEAKPVPDTLEEVANTLALGLCSDSVP